MDESGQNISTNFAQKQENASFPHKVNKLFRHQILFSQKSPTGVPNFWLFEVGGWGDWC